jgi:ABC-type branched-subunit amino acid transport system substrate-binding protein
VSNVTIPKGSSHMMKKTGLAIAVAATLAVTGCAGGESSSKGSDGVKVDKGVSDSEISVALLNDFSGPIAAIGNAAATGAEVNFKEVNAAGGICGRDVVGVREDTKFDPKVSVQAYRAVVDEVVAITQLVGAAPLFAVKDDIARDGITTLSATLSGKVLELENVFVYLPPFEIEVINGIVWAAEQAKATESNPLKIGIVTPADEFGKSFEKAAQLAVDSLEGVELVEAQSFTQTDEDFTSQVTKLRDSGAEAVILTSTPKQTAGILGQSAQFGYEPQWVGYSGSWTSSLAEPLDGLLDNYHVVNSYGTLGDDVQGITDLNAALKKHAPDEKADNMMVAGWITADVTVAALKKACEEKDLTRAGVLKAMENLEVPLRDLRPPVNMGDGKSAVGFETRINEIEGTSGLLTPITDWKASDVAKTWKLN